jgi:MFS family permease
MTTIVEPRLSLALPQTFRALRHRNYRLWWSGQLVSLTGTWMQTVAQSWLVFQLTNSAFLLGLTGFIGSLPILLLSLWGGVVADRVHKRNLLVATQTTAMLQAFLLAFLTWSGKVRVEHVLIMAAILGVVNAFDAPARQAFTIEMVGKEDLMNAIALGSTLFNAARILGPAIAGVLLAVIGTAGCFTLNGVSFLAVIAGLLAMRLPSSPRAATSESALQNLKEGLAYVRSNSTVLSLLALVGTTSLFGMSYVTLMPIFARDVLKMGAQGLGFLTAAAGIGALVGALTLASLGRFRRKGLLLTAGNLLFPAAMAAFAFSRSFPLSLLCLVVAGWAMVAQNATANTLVQTTVPDHLRGRVMSVYTMLFMGMMPFGNLQAGTIASRFGAPFAVGLGAAICALAALLILWRLPQLRRLE